MYKLKDKPSLIFDILWAMDGNDSLKRIVQRAAAVDGDLGVPGPSCEETDTRHVMSNMYISREDVNKWARELVAKAKVASEGVSFIFTFCSISITDI